MMIYVYLFELKANVRHISKWNSDQTLAISQLPCIFNYLSNYIWKKKFVRCVSTSSILVPNYTWSRLLLSFVAPGNRGVNIWQDRDDSPPTVLRLIYFDKSSFFHSIRNIVYFLNINTIHSIHGFYSHTYLVRINCINE